MTRCVFSEKCRQYDIPDSRNLCGNCLFDAESDIGLLRYDYVDVSQLIARRGGVYDVNISRARPSSVPPIDVSIDTLRSRIADEVRLWELELRVVLRDVLPRDRVRQGYTVDAGVRYLVPRVDALAGLAYEERYLDGMYAEATWCTGADAIARLRRLHRIARTVVGLTEKVVALPGECPGCATTNLRRTEAADEVWCAACRSRMTYDEYRDVMSMKITQISATNSD